MGHAYAPDSRIDLRYVSPTKPKEHVYAFHCTEGAYVIGSEARRKDKHFTLKIKGEHAYLHFERLRVKDHTPIYHKLLYHHCGLSTISFTYNKKLNTKKGHYTESSTSSFEI